MTPRRNTRIGRRQSRSSERGVTIAEILVSMALLTISLVAIAEMQIVASRTLAISRNVSEATQIAAQLGELFHVLPFDHVLLTPDETVRGEQAVPATIGDEYYEEELPFSVGFSLGDHDGATRKNVYELDSRLPLPDEDDRYRVYWRVISEDQNADGTAEAKLVSVYVRWHEANRWKTVQLTQARFNLFALYPQF